MFQKLYCFHVKDAVLFYDLKKYKNYLKQSKHTIIHSHLKIQVYNLKSVKILSPVILPFVLLCRDICHVEQVSEL